jgi:hypothetical protein
MATISKTGIQDGLTSKAEHITRIIDALDGTAATEIIATGSFTGSFIGDGSALTGVSAANKINLPFITVRNENLLDATNYFLGTGAGLFQNPASTIMCSQYVPVTGDIITANIRQQSDGGASDQLATIYLYNATTDVSYSFGTNDPEKLSYVNRTGIVSKSFSTGTIPVTTGDRIVFKIETPTFATDPANTYHFGDIVIQES